MSNSKISFEIVDRIVYDYVNDQWYVARKPNGTENISLGLDNVTKYFKGLYNTKERFRRRTKKLADHLQKPVQMILDNYDHVDHFTYKEVFSLEDETFQSLVFGTIDIREMIEYLGHERIGEEGIELKNKVFDTDGTFKGWEDITQMYEVHRINGKVIDRNDFYAVRCWCTSTDSEAWLYIQEQYKDDPLTAIASTFRIHKNLIPYIKEIKRQGDVMVAEFDPSIKEDGVEPQEPVVALDKETFFDRLTCQT